MVSARDAVEAEEAFLDVVGDADVEITVILFGASLQVAVYRLPDCIFVHGLNLFGFYFRVYRQLPIEQAAESLGNILGQVQHVFIRIFAGGFFVCPVLSMGQPVPVLESLPKAVQQVGVLGMLFFPPVQDGLIETDEVIKLPVVQHPNLGSETLAQVVPLLIGLATDDGIHPEERLHMA